MNICFENTIDFYHRLYFPSNHKIIFLYFKDDYLTVFQVFNFVDMAEATSVNVFEYFESIFDNDAIEGVGSLPFAVDSLNRIVHIIFVGLF